MDSFSSAIKNQHSFNKMIESQIAQLVTVVPPTDKGKIPGQPEYLETANLVDIHNVAGCYIKQSTRRWGIIPCLPRKEIQETHHPHRHWTSHISRSYR
jgi:hypothetical protein